MSDELKRQLDEADQQHGISGLVPDAQATHRDGFTTRRRLPEVRGMGPMTGKAVSWLPTKSGPAELCFLSRATVARLHEAEVLPLAGRLDEADKSHGAAPYIRR